MTNLIGKCPTCLGCNLLEVNGFKGRLDCDYYRYGEVRFTFIDNICKEHDRKKDTIWQINKGKR